MPALSVSTNSCLEPAQKHQPRLSSCQPLSLFQSTMKAKGWLKASHSVGREVWSSVLWDKPAPTPK